MASEARSFDIRFLPENKTIRVAENTLLVDAAARLGIFLDLPCGGQGRCGRCRVKIENGKVTHGENPHLTAEQAAAGWITSCTARVASDLTITVPPKKEREKIETAASRKAAAPVLEWPRYPAVREVVLDLPPASLEDSASDLDRLQRELRKSLGIEKFSFPFQSLKELPHTLRQSDWKVTVIFELAISGTEARIIQIHPGKYTGPLVGAAVDIGTTNVVIYLVDLRTGKMIDSNSELNKQISCGEDVISRIIYSLRPNGLGHLQDLVRQNINGLLADMAKKHSIEAAGICDMVVAANTIMTHIFLGLPPKYMREEPYAPVGTRFPPVKASDLGVNINPEASIFCMPNVAAYVGGDIVSGVLSSGIYKKDKLTLFIDVGTNGEIVLGNSDFLMTDACSAGPAFEGAGIRFGMRATKGAIEDVRINSQTLEPSLKVIGDVPPAGICGSGLLSALAEMLVTGVVGRSGRFNLDYVNSRMGDKSRARKGDHGGEYVLAWASESGAGEDIVLTEVDINNLLRAKGAVYAGITVMLEKAGVAPQEIQEVLIGGAFGQHLDVEEAIQIGLFPDLPWERFKYLGNTSVWGAYMALLSLQARAQADELANKMTYLELIADNSFMNEFTAALFLPHTKIETFPSVKKLLEGAKAEAR